MNKTLAVLSLTIVSLLIAQAQGRSVELINVGWKFHKGEVHGGPHVVLNDGSWESINLPHTWNREDPWANVSEHEDLFITHHYYRGPGWYRKKFVIPQRDKNRRLHILFEGANTVAEVWLNARSLGKHVGGYSAFSFDATEAVRFGKENILAVKVDNSYNYDIPPQRADYTMYGGIYRDVVLIKTAPVYTERMQISTPFVSEDSATTVVEVFLSNTLEGKFNGRVDVVVKDPSGKTAMESSAHVGLSAKEAKSVKIHFPTLSSPILWSDRSPKLYECIVGIVDGNNTLIDRIDSRFGYRWFMFDADKGFFLNGKHTPLRGVNRHQDRKGYGNALPNDLHVYDMALIKSLGANFVRLAHYPQDPAVLNACDSLGLVVWEEIPVVSSVGRERFRENAKTMLREMIIQHYNHPSIIIWGVMNETARTQPDEDLPWTVELCRELHVLAKKLDPLRKTAQAQFGDRGTDLLTITDIRGWNRYFGWYYGEFSEFGPFLDEDRKKAPDQVIMVSEYGAGNLRGYHSEKPMPSDFTEEWAVALHRSTWKQIRERPYIAGSAVWNMFDFASDEKNGNDPRINQKGLATFDRKPKDVFYFYQSQWSKTPMVYIVSHTWRDRYGIKGVKKPIEVFSNCDDVELWVNGVSQGRKSPPFVWDVPLQHGYHTLRARGTSGATVVEDVLQIKYTELEGGTVATPEDKEQ